MRLNDSARKLLAGARAAEAHSMEAAMRRTNLSLPELALIAGTRGMLGAGIGLLVADRIPPDTRKWTGWSLFLIGALSTIPLAIDVLSKSRSA